jgi:CheY-like chemotaxis protein
MSETPKRTVLIADDDDEQRYLLSRVLQRAGYVTCEVPSGDKVLEAARAGRPDVIVLDVVMPGQDGFTTGRQLKADPDVANIPIVFLTGRTTAADRKEGLSLGASQYLLKSLAARELVRCLENVLTAERAR